MKTAAYAEKGKNSAHRYKDLIVTGAILAWALFFLLIIPSEIRLVPAYADELSPRFFPYLCAAALLFFATVTLVGSFKHPDPPDPFMPGELNCVLITMLLVGAGVLIAPYVGLSPATTLMLLSLCFYFGERGPVVLGSMAVAWPLFLYGLFNVAFSTPLPKGVWFQ